MSELENGLWWRHGRIDQPLASALNDLAKKVGSSSINWAYVERRPGSNLDNQQTTAVLIESLSNADESIALDEVRLFANDGGLHAIEDAKQTRWMQWQVGERTPQAGQEPWSHEPTVEKEGYSICMLDAEGARRFCLDHDVLPALDTLLVVEYRRGGELFCWNLLEKSNG